MRKNYFLIVFILFYHAAYTQNSMMSTLKVVLTGKEYEELELKLTNLVNPDEFTFSYKGIPKGNNLWEFSYPDSLYEHITKMEIFSPTPNDSTSNDLFFNLINKSDTLMVGSYFFKRGLSSVKAKYLRTDKYSDSFFYNIKTKQEGKRTEYQDQFVLENCSDEEILASIDAIRYYYGMFFQAADTLSKKELLMKYIEITKKYSNSYFLVANLAATVTLFPSKKDVKSVFDLFSDNVKKSFFGEKVNRYINTRYFENTCLSAWNTNIKELIIQDSTKYNLIVFSASWCGPCHKLIPPLKEIYKDMLDKLDIVYVSIDEPETIDEWKKLMQKESIPWRSVLAADRLNEIKEKYTVQTIPLSILVALDGSMQPLNIADEKQREVLYNLIF